MIRSLRPPYLFTGFNFFFFFWLHSIFPYVNKELTVLTRSAAPFLTSWLVRCFRTNAATRPALIQRCFRRFALVLGILTFWFLLGVTFILGRISLYMHFCRCFPHPKQARDTWRFSSSRRCWKKEKAVPRLTVGSNDPYNPAFGWSGGIHDRDRPHPPG